MQSTFTVQNKIEFITFLNTLAQGCLEANMHLFEETQGETANMRIADYAEVTSVITQLTGKLANATHEDFVYALCCYDTEYREQVLDLFEEFAHEYKNKTQNTVFVDFIHDIIL